MSRKSQSSSFVDLNGAVVKEYLAKKNIKLWLLADEIGVHKRTVSRWINKKSVKITADNLNKLASVLNCQQEELVNIEQSTIQFSNEDQKILEKLCKENYQWKSYLELLKRKSLIGFTRKDLLKHRFEESLAYYFLRKTDKAKSILQDLVATEFFNKANVLLCRIMHMEGEVSECISSFNKIETSSSLYERNDFLSLVLDQIQLYIDCEDHPQAQTLLKKYHVDLCNHDLLIPVLQLEGQIFMFKNNFKRAQSKFDQALSLALENFSLTDIFRINFLYARLCFQLNREQEFNMHLEQCRKIAKKINLYNFGLPFLEALYLEFKDKNKAKMAYLNLLRKSENQAFIKKEIKNRLLILNT